MEAVILRVEELQKTGSFGPGKLIRVRNTLDDEKGMQFMSQLFFLTVDMESPEGIVEVPVVVKIRPSVPDELSAVGPHEQFVNEVSFYSNVLPEFGALGSKLCPNMYFGYATDGKDYDRDMIVLEDIRASGFALAKDLFLDKDRITIAMRKLGEFHGLSYKLKKTSPALLKRLAEGLVNDPHFDYDNGMLAGGLLRGFKDEMKDHPDDGLLERAYSKMSSGSLNEQWHAMRKPEEPFAVIVHGDFNKNNLMYAYDKDGKVSDVKFFDFGTTMYSDPAIDISFMLYVNTTAESRDRHWEGYLQAYWDGVITVERDPGFSFEQFRKQFAKRAVWGYFPCCFYLPMLMFPEEMPENFDELDENAMKEVCLNWGGEAAEKAVVDIVLDLYKRGYLEEYVEHFNL